MTDVKLNFLPLILHFTRHVSLHFCHIFPVRNLASPPLPSNMSKHISWLRQLTRRDCRSPSCTSTPFGSTDDYITEAASLTAKSQTSWVSIDDAVSMGLLTSKNPKEWALVKWVKSKTRRAPSALLAKALSILEQGYQSDSTSAASLKEL